jgi:multidrug efflux system outer membrane protein
MMRAMHRQMSTPMGAARTLLGGTLAALLLGGCAVGPKYQRPDPQLPAAFPETAASASGTAIAPDWWKLYNDPLLTDLVDAALVRNVDLAIAAAQIQEAQAVLRETGAATLPEIGIAGGVNRTGTSTSTAIPSPPGVPSVRNNSRAILQTSFEIDLWGKMRSATDAAQARVFSQLLSRDMMRLLLSSTVAQNYFTLRSLDAQIAMTRTTIATRDETLKIVGNRVRAGYASDLDLSQARLARANAATQLRELERLRAGVEHQLQTLTGRLDLKVAPNDIVGLDSLPVPALPPAGLPSTLVDRRPDVAAAEQALISANAQIGVARAAQYPTFSLTGFLGSESETLRTVLLSPARIWSVGANVLFPIFDAGRYAARTEQAEARQQQALANYQRTVQVAYRDVSDALSNLRQTVVAEADLRNALVAARDALRIAQVRYDAGYSAFLDVLDAQRNVNDAELALARNRQQQLVYTVDFIKAVGGGWTATTS